MGKYLVQSKCLLSHFRFLKTIITKEGEEWEDLGPDFGPIPVSFGTLPSLSEPPTMEGVLVKAPPSLMSTLAETL